MKERSAPEPRWFWLGFGVGCAFNLITASLLVCLSLVVFLGAGLSSNPTADASNWNLTLLAWLACPAGVNLPGVLYALLTRRWGFLKGWLLSLGLAALLLLCAGLLAGAYGWLLGRSEGAGV